MVSHAILYCQKQDAMNATILLIETRSPELNITAGYVIGAIIAVLILGYLLYSLIKPEKF